MLNDNLANEGIIMHTIKYNTVYTFDLRGKVMFGDLPEPALNKMYQDGRVASHLLEQQLPLWFTQLTFVDRTGYDYVDGTDHKWDLKGFTKRGANFAPSCMIGAGRKVVEAKLAEHVSEVDYIFSDITQFPTVRIVFKVGKDLIKIYPKGKISYTKMKSLFE